MGLSKEMKELLALQGRRKRKREGIGEFYPKKRRKRKKFFFF